MFTRLRETFRVITYRAPEEHGPDAVIVEKRNERVPKSGKVIAGFLEALIAVVVLGWAAGNITKLLEHFHVTRVGVSIVTLAGAIGVLLAWILHNFMLKFQWAIRRWLSLERRLAPNFGHKLDDTLRTLRG